MFVMAESSLVAYPPLPCRASPPQGGRLAGGTTFATNRDVESRASGRHKSISPLEGEMPGRAEGGGRNLNTREAHP
jgi:hypothetical protein